MYLGKRDFVDHITHVDPIDGVVLIDPDYVKDRKVFGNVLAAFRYGREDLDVLGLTFRKDLYLAQDQVGTFVRIGRFQWMRASAARCREQSRHFSKTA